LSGEVGFCEALAEQNGEVGLVSDIQIFSTFNCSTAPLFSASVPHARLPSNVYPTSVWRVVVGGRGPERFEDNFSGYAEFERVAVKKLIWYLQISQDFK
jgi:hypothetical protein